MADHFGSFHGVFNPSSSWSWGRVPSGHFNFAFLNLISYRFYFLQAPGMASRCSHLHTLFSFAIPTMLNFLVLKYQNLDKSPFDSRPKTILFGILSLLLYCFSNLHQQRLHMTHPASSPALARILHRCTLFFGYMAVACLASLLFPESASPAFYALYVTVSVGDLLYLLFQMIKNQFRRSRFQRQGNLLPL